MQGAGGNLQNESYLKRSHTVKDPCLIRKKLGLRELEGFSLIQMSVSGKLA